MSGLVVEAESGLRQFHAMTSFDGKPFDGVIWVGKSIPRWQMTRIREGCTCTEFFKAEKALFPSAIKKVLKSRGAWNASFFVCACQGNFIE